MQPNPGVRLRALLALIAACLATSAVSPPFQSPWTLQQSGTRESLRGLSVVNERVVWASGNRGTFVRTVDAGTTWQADTIAGKFMKPAPPLIV